MDKYTWFFYIGIFLFVTHVFIHGINLDLSYFGLFLIILGWRKWVIWGWVNILIWIFIVIEILATIFRLQKIIRNYLDPNGIDSNSDTGSDDGSDDSSDDGSDDGSHNGSDMDEKKIKNNSQK